MVLSLQITLISVWDILFVLKLDCQIYGTINNVDVASFDKYNVEFGEGRPLRSLYLLLSCIYKSIYIYKYIYIQIYIYIYILFYIAYI